MKLNRLYTKYLLASILLFVLLLSSNSSMASLVASYSFDEGYGPFVADSSGNNNIGTITGASWVKLPVGYCLSFDGIDDFVNCGTGSSLNLTSSVTMIAWVCPWGTQFASEPGICGKGFGSYLLTSYANNSSGFYIKNGSHYVTCGLNPGDWNQVAATYNGSTLKIYINGVLQSQTSYSSSIPAGSNFWIGAVSGSPITSPFKGLIDGVKVYNNALTDAEIASQFSATTHESYNSMNTLGVEDGLAAHYTFDAGTGTTVSDTSCFNNNGTAYNTTWSPNPTSADGYSLGFNGTSSYVNCGNQNGLDIRGPITVTAWVNPSSTQNGEVGIAGKDFGSYIMTYYNGSVYWYINWSAGRSISNALPANTWSHVVGTYDKGYLRLYINGALVQTSTSYTAAINAGANFYIGRAEWQGTNYFNGNIDEVRVYNRALPAKEIKTIYQLGVTPSVRLNALVTQLLKKQTVASGSYQWNYTIPYDGWIYFKSSASLGVGEQVTINDVFNSNTLNVITQNLADGSIVENMRYLKKGMHQLQVSVTGSALLKGLDVRAVPELTHCQYPAGSRITNFGTYNWEYLSEYVWPNVNTMITDGSTVTSDRHIASWKAQGKRVVQDCILPNPSAYDYWWSQPGYASSLGDGIIVDEFVTGSGDSRYTGWSADIDSIYANPSAEGKPFYAYLGGVQPWTGEPGRTFVNNVVSHGGAMNIEYYQREESDQRIADSSFQYMKAYLNSFDSVIPGANRNTVFSIGYMSAPNEFLSISPEVDFKAHLDRAMHLFTTDLAYQDLYGISMYLSSYTDEEIVRWASTLYRHYCIEGKTSYLSDQYGYTYNTKYIQNPDFASGTNNWTLYPANASPVSISSGVLDGTSNAAYGLSWLEGRYPPTTTGNSYLKTKRYANAPNNVEQTITGLVPGKYYSIKMIAADYTDLTTSTSVYKDLPVRLYLTSGGTTISNKTFKEVYISCYSHDGLGFNVNNPAYLNYFQVVFRADSETANLRISDWPSDAGIQGATVGQEIVYNFIEVEPYYFGVEKETDGLVANYKFDEGSGNLANDSSGKSGPAIIYGTTNWTPVDIGYCLNFDGTTNYLDCGVTNQLDLRNEITISAWVAPYSTTNNNEQGIAGKGFASYLLSFKPDEGKAYWNINNSTNSVKSNVISNNLWSLVTATFDGTNIKIYVNGQLVSTQASSYSQINQGANFLIGCIGTLNGLPTNAFKGLIDDVKVYNRTLSSAEVEQSFSTQELNFRNAMFNNETDYGLMAHYKFDEGTGTTAIDSSGRNNTGSIVGASWELISTNQYALSFDGIDDYVDCGNAPALDIHKYITTMFWVKPATTQNSNEPGIVGKGMDSYVSTYYTNSTLYWYINSGGNNVNGAVSTNTWTHITTTYDGSYLTIYKNGILLSQNATSITSINSGSNLYVGVTGVSGYFKGSIDSVKIYNRALSANEIAGQYLVEYYTRNNIAPNTIASAKVISTGSTVYLKDASVSAKIYSPDGSYYGFAVEEQDRFMGIRVITTAIMNAGQKADVYGYMYRENGEYVIDARLGVVLPTGSVTPIAPYSVATIDTGGGLKSNQGAVLDNATKTPKTSSIALNNVGMLMRIRGIVTAVGADYFYVNDGYGVNALLDGSGYTGMKCGKANLTSLPAVGDNVEVTGVVGVKLIGGYNTRYMWTTNLTTATISTYAFYVHSGLTDFRNMISLPAQPVNPEPAILFAGIAINNNLQTYTGGTSAKTYTTATASTFGGINYSYGYSFDSSQSNPYAFTYLGYNDPTPLDRWISVPNGVSGGSVLIGVPYNHAVKWNDWHATDLTTLKSVQEADTSTWLDISGDWYLNGVANLLLPGDSLYQNYGYKVRVNKKLAIIAPSISTLDKLITGCVLLEDFIGNGDVQIGQIPIIIGADNNTTNIFRAVVSTQITPNSGNFFIDVNSEIYNISLKASHWLRKLAADFNVDVIVLINGDVVDNNEVDFTDINAVRAAYGSFPGDGNWNEKADVDGSGEVDFTDINIVRSNYGEIGD